MSRSTRTRRRHSQRGFTLIELMVSLVLFAVVTAGLMSVAVTMAKGFHDQDAVVDTESASRASMDYISDTLRTASPGVPLNSIVDLSSNTCETGAFRFTNNAPTTNAGVYTNTSDKLTIIYASGAVVTTALTAFTAPGALSVVDSSEISAGDFVLITDFQNGHLAYVTSTSPGVIDIDAFACGTPINGGTGYPAGSVVIRAQKASFFIQDVDNVPALMFDADADGIRYQPEPIAEGIEDLEIAVGVDADGNGILNKTGSTTVFEDTSAAGADEWQGNVNGEIPDNSVFVPAGPVRAVRISLVARSTIAYSGVNTYKLGAVEDRPANGAVDNFRRRTLSTIIEIRNLEGSP